MKRTILLLLMTLLIYSCQKDGVFPKDAPEIDLDVQWIPPRTFILTGETFEKCDRGFMIAFKQGDKIEDKDVIVLPYDIQGVGKFNKEITLDGATRIYIKAWATRGVIKHIGYSKEVSFDVW